MMMMNKTQTQSQNKSQYEISRDERIKANLERMQKLGLADISLQLKSHFQAKRTTKRFSNPSCKASSPIQKPGPIRRSSRLQNSTPVRYAEVPLGKEDEGKKTGSIMLEEGARREIYTEEHEKLLGRTEKSWTLFVDGYGTDGKRIYDPVRGRTCHQCRQKTLGHRTECSQCHRIVGQFCGDCLYMRYGEHVLEAIENPEWICPVCRGICNCSFCRTSKGWPPTGTLYRKVVQLGFKSVAHYLIQTRRAETSLVKTPETPEQVSARKSLPSPESDENLKADDHKDLGPLTPLGEQKGEDEFKSEKDDETQNNADLDINNQTSAKRTLSFPDIDHLGLPKLQSDSSTDNHKEEEEIKVECVDLKLGDCTNGVETTSEYQTSAKRTLSFPDIDHLGLPKLQSDSSTDNQPKLQSDHLGLPKLKSDSSTDNHKEEEEIKVECVDLKLGDCTNGVETTSESKKKQAHAEPSADTIGGRLRRRRQKEVELDNDSSDTKEKIPDAKILSEKEVKKEICVLFTDNKDSGDRSMVLKGSSKLKKKRILVAEPSADIVAGRLRQRRRGN